MVSDHKHTTGFGGETGSGFGSHTGVGLGGPFDPFDPQSALFSSGFPGAGQPGLADASATQTVLYAPDATKGGGHGSGGGGTTSGSGTPTSGTSPSSFVINISWDSSVSSAPSGFTTAVMNAVQYLESQFTDAVTINIDVGYGEVAGSSLGSTTLGASESYLSSVGYSSLVNALTSDATSAADASAVASLPSTSPVNGTFWTTTAEAKAIGLASPTGTSLDGYVGFSSSLPFTYDDTNGVTSGTYDFNGVAIHEMSEVMGRMLLTGATVGGTSNSYMPYDLFHYASAGVRDFSASTPGYFSIDSGTTNLAAFNTVSGGDAGDWASSVTNDSFDAFSNSGVVNGVSSADLTALDVIGWNTASASTSSPTAPAAPTGVSIAPATGALAAAQSTSGLAANAPLATIAEVGGTSGDQYTYTLGGTGAAAFSLTDAANKATLSAGSSGVAGASAGQLYALTLTANDTTAGTSSPAAPLDVVVGTGGSETIHVGALVGASAAATPTFVYGMGGADTLDGSGMTGTLMFAGGAGADTMTGGSGTNDYLYGATGDSTATAMDVITNFHAGTDLIDLTGLGTSLKYAGKIHKGQLGAHAIGWQSSGGETYVYVNTSGATESLSGTDMKIDLHGSIALTSGNFQHL